MITTWRRVWLILLTPFVYAPLATAHTSVAGIAQHPEVLRMAYGYSTSHAADEAALGACREAARKAKLSAQDCGVAHRANSPGWTAVVCAPDARDCGMASGLDSKEGAFAAARDLCSGTYPGRCTTNFMAFYDSFEPPTPPKSQQKKPPAQPTLTASCLPPRGETVRYRYSCHNADCVRTYENGCQEKFQAPYCWNPLHEKFEFMPDGC